MGCGCGKKSVQIVNTNPTKEIQKGMGAAPRSRPAPIQPKPGPRLAPVSILSSSTVLRCPVCNSVLKKVTRAGYADTLHCVNTQCGYIRKA